MQINKTVKLSLCKLKWKANLRGFSQFWGLVNLNLHRRCAPGLGGRYIHGGLARVFVPLPVPLVDNNWCKWCLIRKQTEAQKQCLFFGPLSPTTLALPLADSPGLSAIGNLNSHKQRHVATFMFLLLCKEINLLLIFLTCLGLIRRTGRAALC